MQDTQMMSENFRNVFRVGFDPELKMLLSVKQYKGIAFPKFEEIPIQVLDLSAGGLKIETDLDFQTHSSTVLKLWGYIYEVKRELYANILWKKKLENGKFWYGLRLLDFQYETEEMFKLTTNLQIAFLRHKKVPVGTCTEVCKKYTWCPYFSKDKEKIKIATMQIQYEIDRIDKEIE